MSTLTHNTAASLCGLLDHTLTTYAAASHDPGAVICDSEGCVSQKLVALDACRRILHMALATLTYCACGSPAACSCEMEPVRNEVHRAEVEAAETLRMVLAGAYPLTAQALDAQAILGRTA